MKATTLGTSKSLVLISLLLIGRLCLGQSVSLSTKTGPPTTETMASGSGFTPYASIRIFFDSTKLAVANADASGAFSNVSIQVPASAPPGLHRVIARTPSSGTRGQASFLVRTNWSQFRFAADLQGLNPYENVLLPTAVGNLKLRWKYTTKQYSYSLSSSPAVVNGVAYFGSYDRNFYALNASSGAVLWQYQTGGEINSSPAVANGVVYFASNDAKLYALDAKTGALLWTFTRGNDVYFTYPTVSNRTVYVGANDNKIYALNAKTGALLWKYTAGYWFTSAPAVSDGVVYAGSNDYSLYALDSRNGSLLWKYTTGSDIWFAAPAVANGVVYVGSRDFNLYALDAKTGALRWQFMTGDQISTSLSVANGVVYVGSADATLYALDASTGTLLWTYFGIGWSLPTAVAGGVVYVTSLNADLYALDASTGTLLWQYSTAPAFFADSAPAVTDGVMYIMSWDGSLNAFDLNGK